MANTRTGLLIIRAWAEPGSSSPLRVRVRLTTDVSVGLERSETLTQADTVLEVVRAWLSEMDHFLASAADAEGPEKSR